MALQLLRLGKIGLRMSFSNTPLVLPWPLQIGLELATRALLDPGDQSSVDFSRPAGEPALVSPDSVSVMVSRSAREQTAQRFSAIGMRQGGNRVIRPPTRYSGEPSDLAPPERRHASRWKPSHPSSSAR